MAVLGRELSGRLGWITPEDYALAFAVARVTPGTNIIAFCAAVGWQILRFSGALAAVIALTAPTAVLAVFILKLLESGTEHPAAHGSHRSHRSRRLRHDVVHRLDAGEARI